MQDQLSLDWRAFGRTTHDFAIVNGTLAHDWDGGPGETIYGEGNELHGVTLTEVTGEIQADGTCHLLVRANDGRRFRVWQGASEAVWHAQAEEV